MSVWLATLQVTTATIQLVGATISLVVTYRSRRARTSR